MEPELWLLQCKEQHMFLRKRIDDVSSCSDSTGGSILLERVGKKNSEANELFDALRKDTLEGCGKDIKSSSQQHKRLTFQKGKSLLYLGFEDERREYRMQTRD